MRFVPILVMFLSSLFPLFSTPAVAQADSCQFVLGFASLHDLMPGVVGGCAVDEHHNPANGDGLQETTGADGAGGLLVWRKADNWTAFTDGYWTWINGPFGLRKRLNTECFDWENGCTHPIPSTNATVTFTSVVGAAPGGTASATVQTSPNLACRIDYFGPLGHDRNEKGALDPTRANASGVATWSWVIAPNTPPGNGTVTVTCDRATATSPITIGTGTPVTVTFTSVVGAARGAMASVSVHTLAGASCKIDYFGPLKLDRFEDGALHSQMADANGNVTWSWLIAANTATGNGTVNVTCNGVTATTPIAIS